MAIALLRFKRICPKTHEDASLAAGPCFARARAAVYGWTLILVDFLSVKREAAFEPFATPTFCNLVSPIHDRRLKIKQKKTFSKMSEFNTEAPWPVGLAGYPAAKIKANGIVQIIFAIVLITVSGVMINSTTIPTNMVQLKPLISFQDGGSYILSYILYLRMQYRKIPSGQRCVH